MLVLPWILNAGKLNQMQTFHCKNEKEYISNNNITWLPKIWSNTIPTRSIFSQRIIYIHTTLWRHHIQWGFHVGSYPNKVKLISSLNTFPPCNSLKVGQLFCPPALGPSKDCIINLGGLFTQNQMFETIHHHLHVHFSILKQTSMAKFLQDMQFNYN